MSRCRNASASRCPTLPGADTSSQFCTMAAVSMGSGDGAAAGARSQTPSPGERPLPPPVQVRSEPEVALGDPAFEPLPGARADFGRLGGAVYQIEVPGNWNGQLVLDMHGYGELGPEARVGPPDFRRY